MTASSKRKGHGTACKFGVLGLGFICVLSLAIASCKTMDSVTKAATTLGVGTGGLTPSRAASIQKSVMAVAKTFQDITPEQEYYIGRTIGAIVLNKYKPYNNSKVNRYINVLGQTLARASDRPETFGGYYFLVLDSEDINAFATPGGFIFVTRGLLRCCQHEDALASILAHEIGHVQLKHGLQAIKQSRITSAITTLGIEGAKAYGGQELSTLTKTFENTISDVIKTLVNNGYSRSFERQADKAAVTILRRVGYDPNGLVEMLNVMKQRLKPGGIDFAKTHPSPAGRISDIQKTFGGYVPVKKVQTRQARFLKHLRNI